MGIPKAETSKRGRSDAEPDRLGHGMIAFICIAVLAGVATLTVAPRGGVTGEPVEFRGGPRLSVDRELIDFGPVRYNQFVEARFRLKNVGDQPLRLPPSPRVEVVEGC